MASTLFEPGFRLGKYEVIAHLSTGGMGAVYQAVDRELGRIVALKVLSPNRAESDLLTERFRREARNAARLNHPNIVTLYECGFDVDRNVLYLALEFIDGMDLAKFIVKRGSLRPEETRRILMQAAKALAHAFAHGIVHRDIKPSNIMLTRVGKKILVKVTDLGLAIAKGEDEYRLTREGNTVGTIDYMAPEQARDSQSADTRSDIYSLGCTAYHMLAGKPPFAQGGLGERLFRHLEMAPPDVRQFNPAVSAGFWVILERMLAKKPEDRYASPDVLLQALKRLPADEAAAENATAPLGSARRTTQHVSTAPTRVVPPAVDTPQEHPPAPVVTLDQAQAAAGLRERALQILGQEKGEEYTRELLEKSLQLDPFNLASRQALRELHRSRTGGILGRWFRSLNVFAIKASMRLARSSGDWRKVFEQGEKVLACQPADVETHLELAETAAEIGLPDLARWFLEQGRMETPDNGDLLRALARLHEHLQLWKPAVALWQKVLELEPANDEARRKVTELSAQEMVANYQHRRV
jgi:serine/threonine protein kinase